jgi:hypothetical protein
LRPSYATFKQLSTAKVAPPPQANGFTTLLKTYSLIEKATRQRQIKLAEDIQANLSGVKAKPARKWEKPLAHTVRQLSRKAARKAARFRVHRLI